MLFTVSVDEKLGEIFYKMTGTFKIKKDKVKWVVYRALKNISLQLLIPIPFILTMVVCMVPKNELPIYIIPMSFSLIIFAAYITYMYNFTIIAYDAYELSISEKGLHKRIDIDDNKIITGYREWIWNHVKTMSKQHDTFIDWKKIKKVKRNKHELIIKARYSDLYGYGVIVIPNVLEDYEMVLAYIEHKTKRID